MRHIRILRRERSGATALEFAIISGVFLPLCMAIVGAGLLLWTKGALQSVASLTARCAAISSTDCTDVQQFAVTTGGRWIFPGIIVKADVTPAPAIVCISQASYMKVTINCRFWARIVPAPFNNKTLTAIAYFPVARPAC